MPVLLIAVGLLGLAVGSFLNVVVYRVPAGLSLVRPGSHCPACDMPIRARHNVPVFGWLILRGRCADCAVRINPRYPLIELVTACLFVAVAAHLATTHQLAALPADLVFVAAGITLSAIDLDLRKLPNRIVYPTLAAVLLLMAGAALAEGSPAPFVRAAIGAAVLFALFGAIATTVPHAFGFGDAKLAAVAGATLGFASYPAVVVGLFSALVVGALIATIAVVSRPTGRATSIPFGPALVTGALIGLFTAVPVAHAYANLTHRT